jgi:hypothetical protein
MRIGPIIEFKNLPHPILGQMNLQQSPTDFLWNKRIIELAKSIGKISVDHENTRISRNVKSKSKDRISESCYFVLSLWG